MRPPFLCQCGNTLGGLVVMAAFLTCVFIVPYAIYKWVSG